MSDNLDLFVRISRLLPSLEGWCSEAKAHTLAAAIIALRPEITVEIGVWGGKSLIPMALAHKQIGRGYVIGIDPWHPVESKKGQEHPNDAKFWGEANHEAIYAGFMNAIYANGLEKIVRVNRRASDAVEPPPRIDLLHIDGNHSDQAVRDVERFASKCRIGALCIIDDVGWTGGGVDRAVKKLHNMSFDRLYDLEKGIVFQRV